MQPLNKSNRKRIIIVFLWKTTKKEVLMMSKAIITILTIVAIVIWFAVSREAVKPSKEINWRKMIILLATGSILTLIVTISLYQSLLL
ncbi:hypothetical protein ACXYMZ_13470 [Oceanobacillus sp. CAU 1775]